MAWVFLALVSVMSSGHVHAQAPEWHTTGQKTASGSGTALSVARPDNVSEGDLIILTFTQQRSAASAGSSFTTPAGFTLIRSEQATGTTSAPEVVSFYKIATASEPTAYTSTVTNHGSTPNWKAVASRVTGHDPANPISTTSTGVNTGTDTENSITLPSLGTDGNNSLLVAARAVRRSISSETQPTGMQVVASENGSGNHQNADGNAPALAVATQAIPAQGATGSRQFAWGGNPQQGRARAAGLMFAINALDVPTTDLGVSLSLSGPAGTPGGQAVVVAEVTNAGPLPATGVVVSFDLGNGLEISSGIGDGNLDIPSAEWTIGFLPANESASLELTLDLQSAGSFVIEAMVAGDQADNNTSNDTASLAVDDPDGGGDFGGGGDPVPEFTGGPPTVNGLFYGNGDHLRYPATPYAVSDQGSRLYVTLIDGTLYVALVNDRSVNDNLFAPGPGGQQPYMNSGGWGSHRTARRLIDSEYAEFTLTVGQGANAVSYTWKQGYAGQPGLSATNANKTLPTWISDTTVSGGVGTAPPGTNSASSLMWNMNNYATRLAAGTNTWTMPGTNTDPNTWQSPFNPSAPNDVTQVDGFPATGQITFSETYEWEWSMVYEWSVDMTQFGASPVFVVTGSSHHSPKKTGTGEDDPFTELDPNDPTPLLDFGDLPAPYPTLLADNGARHIIDPVGARLGDSVDSEVDGQPHPLALGDDLAGVDDEDGITLLTPLIPGETATFNVNVGVAGFVSAFIDWNGDGTLDPVDIVSVTGPVAVTTGTWSDTEFAAAGDYQVIVQVPSSAEGLMASRFRITNEAGQGGASPDGEALSGEVEDYIFTATLGDRVWLDLNQDGIQDPDEPGFAGVSVELYDSANDLVATTITDPDGDYLFTGLVPGEEYSVVVVAPAGYSFSPQFAGNDPEVDSNADANGEMPAVILFPGETNLSLDAGLFAQGAIGDTVFFDWNGNGQQDPGEAGIPGVTVELYDSDGTTLLFSTVTDATGFYLFPSLPPGTYVVSVPAPGSGGVPSGYTLTASPDSPPALTHTVNLGVDEIFLDADFGYQPSGDASIGDTVFEDVNQTGTFNPGDGDVGIEGVTVRLYHDVNGTGDLDAGDLLITTTTTDGDGLYLFENLDPGLSYLVVVDDGPGSAVDGHFFFTPTLTTSFNPYPVGPTEFAASSNAFLDADFGYFAPPPSSISGHTFHDLDNNGVFEPGDPPLGQVEVSLFLLDPFGNRIPVATTETATDGSYSFTGLAAGNYVVVVNTSDPDIPDGLVTSLPEIFVPLGVGEDVEDVDFPFVLALEKSVDKSQTFPGDILTYTIRATPPAGGPVSNLRVVDPIPANTSFVAAGNGGVLENGNVVWELGTTQPAVQGTLTANPLIFAFRGGDTSDVWQYNVNDAEWTAVQSYGDPVFAGGSLVYTGTDGDVFGLRGNSSRDFQRLNINTGVTGEWTPRESLPGASSVVDEGGSMAVLNGMVYALAGNNSNQFLRYDPADDTWTLLANAPGAVGRSGTLSSDGQLLYALRGGNTADFWRYDPNTDAWTSLEPAPLNLGGSGTSPTLGGGAMAYYSGSMYVLRGDGTTTFWRYDISGDFWTTLTAGGAPMAQAPGPVSQGAAMVFRSVRFYTMLGNGRGFYRYNIAENDWTQLPDTPDDVLWGGSLASVGGVPARETQISAPFVARDGAVVTVRVALSACGNCPNDTNIAPPALTVGSTGGASATLLSGPEPAPQDLPTETTNFYFYTFEVQAGATPVPQSLTFSLPEFTTGDLPSDFPPASSNSVIVIPDLTLQVQVDSGLESVEILNTARFAGTVSLGQGVCYIITRDTVCGDGVPRLFRVDEFGVTDLGELDVQSVGSLVWSPDNTVLHTTDGNLFGFVDINNGGFLPIGPVVGADPLQGVHGPISASEIEIVAMAFDPTGNLYAVARNPSGPDRLFQINPLTGAFVSDAFGSGVDYRVISETDDRIHVAGIAFAPNGTLYAVAAETGQAGDPDLLVVVPDPSTGTGPIQPVPVANSLNPEGMIWVDDNVNNVFDGGEELWGIEGLSITASGTARVITGSSAPSGFENSLFALNLGTGRTDETIGTAPGCDFSGMACSDQTPFLTFDDAPSDVESATLGDRVWWDLNVDGIQDVGEPGIEGIEVRLLSGTGDPITDSSGTPITATTDPDGLYLFTGLAPGNYSVEFVLPTSGWSFSPQDADGEGTDGPDNSDANPLTGITPVISLAAGETNLNIDAGMILPGSISGLVLADTNNDGIYDLPLSGVLLTLQDDQGEPILDGNGQPRTTTTDGNGFYRFDDLPPGNYRVAQTQPEGFASVSSADGGDPDIIGDVTLIEVITGEENTDNDFLEFRQACPDTWTAWQDKWDDDLGGQTGPTENPDGDRYSNLIEYAFCLPPDSGVGKPFCLFESESVLGGVDGLYRRTAVGGAKDVIYTLEWTGALGSPTSWTGNVVLDGSNTTVVNNGNGTETVRISDLESLTGLTGGTGFVRIRVDLLDENDDVIASDATDVLGWRETEMELCCRTYNNPFLQCALFSGTVDAVTGQVLDFTDSISANTDLGDLLQQGVSYYIEVETGALAGNRFDVVSASGSTLTLALDSSLCSLDAPFNTITGAAPASLVGGRVALHRHWTLDSLFPPDQFGAGALQSEADEVQVFAGGQWRIYWLYDDSGDARWVDAADAGLADQGASVIPPGQGMFFNNRTEVLNLLAFGEVREHRFARPLCEGHNLVGGGYPIDQSANGRELTLARGLFGSGDFSTADSFFLWRTDISPVETGYDSYFLLNAASLERWVIVGDAQVAPRENEILFLGDRAVFLRVADDNPSHDVPAPWAP